jgi:hypothetical protein
LEDFMVTKAPQPAAKTVGDRSPYLSAQRFFGQLHDVVRERLPMILDDLRDLGWQPVVPQLGGERATGYRDLAAQATAKKDKRSGVTFGFHNVTDAAGNPQALAIHITEKSLGENYKLSHPFLNDLAKVAERYGATTGLAWSKPDPLHVQFGDNKILSNPASLKALKSGVIPPVPPPLITHPGFARAMARGFGLQSMFGYSGIQAPAIRHFMTPPKAPAPAPNAPLTQPVDNKMQLRPPDITRNVATPPWQDITRQPFRSVNRPFERPHGFSDLGLRRPSIQSGWTGGFGAPMHLTEPQLSLGIQRPEASLGNFQLRPPRL